MLSFFTILIGLARKALLNFIALRLWPCSGLQQTLALGSAENETLHTERTSSVDSRVLPVWNGKLAQTLLCYTRKTHNLRFFLQSDRKLKVWLDQK